MNNIFHKKILFIEPAAHHEVLRSYVLMFASMGINLDVMSTQKNIVLNQEILPEDCAQYPIDNVTDTNAFLRNENALLNSYSLIILTTDEDVHSQPIIRSWDTITFVLIHHFQSIFDYKKNLIITENILDPIRLIKYLFQNKYSKRAEAIKRFDGYIFPYAIGENERSKIFNKPYVELPFLFNEFQEDVDSITKSIVIPGTLNEHSKSYQLVYSAIKIINETSTEMVDLVLLGSSKPKSGKLIIEKFKKITGDKIRLITFDVEIDQKTYDHYLRKAFILLLPLKINLNHSLVKSIGGRYSLSGSIGDMVRFGKKALVTKGYVLPEFLERHIVFFTKDELADQIKNQLSQKIITRQPYFKPSEILYFKSQINKLLDYV